MPKEKRNLRLTPWMAPEGAPWCSMRCVEGADPNDIATRVAFIEKTPRVRVAPFSGLDFDHKNWKAGCKGNDGWDPEAQGWCDELLRELGYILPGDANAVMQVD